MSNERAGKCHEAGVQNTALSTDPKHRQRLHPPSFGALFEAECTYAYSYRPAHSSSRPSTGLLPTQWKQRSQIAGDAQQSYGVAARKAHSPLGLVGSRREGLGHAHGTSRSTAGDSLGNWSVFLPPEAAGGPYQLTVAAGNQIVLDDVLIGDV